MLKHIAPGFTPPPTVVVMARDGCPHCERAKELLEEHDIVYEEVLVGYVVLRMSFAYAHCRVCGCLLQPHTPGLYICICWSICDLCACIIYILYIRHLYICIS